MSEVKKISPVGSIHGWEESDFGEFVRIEDYAALDSEAQALREEVAALRARVVVVPDELDGQECHSEWEAGRVRGWSDCLDAVERLNGKAVSEGMLKAALTALRSRMCRSCNEPSCCMPEVREAAAQLRDLLGEGKEHE